MKVNEVIVEGLGGWIAGKIAGKHADRAVYDSALKNLLPMLTNRGIDVKNDSTPLPPEVVDPVKDWVSNYMSSGEQGVNQTSVLKSIERVGAPASFTIGTLKKYVKDMTRARANGLAIAKRSPEQFGQLDVPEPTPAPTPIPVQDIKDTLDDQTQYRFPHPIWPGVDAIARKSGWYVTALPKDLKGMIKRDKTTGLYPVLNRANIAKLNDEYDKAADAGFVKVEPIHLL